MTEETLVLVLLRYYQEAGSYRKACVRWGISCQYFYDIIHRRRRIGAPLLAKMGYRRETVLKPL